MMNPLRHFWQSSISHFNREPLSARHESCYSASSGVHLGQRGPERSITSPILKRWSIPPLFVRARCSRWRRNSGGAETNGLGSRIVLEWHPDVYLDEEVVSAYALIDAWTHGTSSGLSATTFLHHNRLSRCHKTTFGLPLPPMRKGLCLFRRDGDFDHLKEDWLQFIYVDQA